LEAALSVGGTLAAELKRAQSIVVQVEALQWFDLVTGPYRAIVAGLPDTSAVRQDLERGHLLLSRALKVTGLKAELEFDSQTGAEVRTKLPATQIGLPAGTVGIGLKPEWQGNTKLTLTSGEDFFIAGELRKFTATGLAGGPGGLGPLIEDVKDKRLRQE
jgi:hypothetical protein